mgnify:CR=1 FL=1
MAVFLGQVGRSLGDLGGLGRWALTLWRLATGQHVAYLSPLELLQEIVVALLSGLRMKDLLHDLLDHLILLLYEALLAQELGPQLLVLSLHPVQLLLQGNLLLVEPLFVSVLERVRDIGPLVEILLGLGVGEVCNALQGLRGLPNFKIVN